MRSVPVAPFAPVPLLFLEAAPDSEFFAFLQEAHRLVAGNPTILDAIDADLNLHGQRKKALRIADAQWIEAQSQALPTMARIPTPVAAESLVLGVATKIRYILAFWCHCERSEAISPISRLLRRKAPRNDSFPLLGLR